MGTIGKRIDYFFSDRFIRNSRCKPVYPLGLGVTLWYFVRIETKELNAFWKERHFGRKLMFSLLCMTVVLLLYYGVLNIVFGPVTHRSTAFLSA